MYDAQSSDFMVYKRRRFSGNQTEQNEIERQNELAAHDYATQLRFNSVIAAQKEKLSKQLGTSSEDVDQLSQISQKQQQIVEVTDAD